MRGSNQAVKVATLLFATALEIQAQPSIARFTIDGGGGTSVGGSNQVSGTIGQPDAGLLSGGGYQIRGGFWVGAGGPAIATETPTPTMEDGIPTSTATPSPTGPFPTPTPTSSPGGATPTDTSPGTHLDVKPDPLDEYIDSQDLIEWVSRTKSPEGDSDVLFEFSAHWQGDYPPSGKTHEADK